jgi:hypothetical protein
MEDEEVQGQMMEIPDDADVIDTDDGGAIVKMGDDIPAGETEWFANLAVDMPESELSSIGSTLADLIEKDKEARKRRDEQYEEGLKRTGLGDDAPGGAQFQGASKVVHPMLTQACVDFAARAMKEIMPPDGPAKDKVVGDPTPEKLEKAERIAKYLNWQCTVQMPEFRAELEQLMTQLPLGGGQYLKITWDQKHKKPCPVFVAIDDVYLPFAATNFYSAERKTHVQYVTKLEYSNRVTSGMYRDVDLMPASEVPNMSRAEVANEKIEGKQPDGYNADGLRTIFEVYVIMEVEEEVGPAPYVISVDKLTQKVLSIYRNWEEDDESKEEMNWMIEFPFVPWRGAYPIGLVHMIGGLSGAATGALRALLDSAHINNFPGLLKLKGGSSGGQTERVDPTEVLEIEGSFAADDIRKTIMPMPYNPPSQVLFALLGFVVDAGTRVVRTTFEDLTDSNQNVPVGTTLARLEQGMVVFSAIHARMHDAMQRVLRLLFRINKMYLDDQEVIDETGELLVKREDFTGPFNVVPVSDPNIFSQTQRFAQVSAVMQRAAQNPALYDQRKVEEMFLQQLKIPDGKSLLIPKPEAKEMNAVNENLAATMQRAVVAFPEQDHLAHLQVHLDFITNPMFGQNRVIGPQAVPLLLNHIKEHMTLWYANQIFEVASEAAGMDISELMRDSDTAEKQSFDKMLAAASQTVSQQAVQVFGQIPQVIEQAMQALQQLQPPPPTDPRIELAQAEMQQRAQTDQANLQMKQAEMQQKAQLEQINQQLKQAELQTKQQDKQLEIETRLKEIESRLAATELVQNREDQRKAADIQARVEMNESDNQTAKELAMLEIATGEKFSVSTGTGINP